MVRLEIMFFSSFYLPMTTHSFYNLENKCFWKVIEKWLINRKQDDWIAAKFWEWKHVWNKEQMSWIITSILICIEWTLMNNNVS